MSIPYPYNLITMLCSTLLFPNIIPSSIRWGSLLFLSVNIHYYINQHDTLIRKGDISCGFWLIGYVRVPPTREKKEKMEKNGTTMGLRDRDGYRIIRIRERSFANPFLIFFFSMLV